MDNTIKFIEKIILMSKSSNFFVDCVGQFLDIVNEEPESLKLRGDEWNDLLQAMVEKINELKV